MNKLKYAVIGSGSKTNSYIFGTGDNFYVIDNGFSLKEFKRRVQLLGFDYSKIKGVFVTHEHSDHLKGVSLLSRDLKIPVYAHADIKGNFHKHIEMNPDKNYNLESDNRYGIDDLNIITFKLSHDAKTPLSYSFKIKDKRLTFITDTGLITDRMYTLCKNTDILFIESNYSPEALKDSLYHESLKARISSNTGHLSNIQTAEILNDLSSEETCNISKVYLCHISDNSNSEDLINEDFKNNYTGRFDYTICNNGEMVEGGK